MSPLPSFTFISQNALMVPVTDFPLFRGGFKAPFKLTHNVCMQRSLGGSTQVRLSTTQHNLIASGRPRPLVTMTDLKGQIK